MNGLTLSLARELAKHKIRVNAVAPGVTHTDMVDALPDSVIKPLIESIPLGRMANRRTSPVPVCTWPAICPATCRAPCFPSTACRVRKHFAEPYRTAAVLQRAAGRFPCICSSKHPHKQYSAFYASWRFS